MSASQIKFNVSPPLPDFFEVGWLLLSVVLDLPSMESQECQN